MSIIRKEFKKGDNVKFTKDYFESDDLGMSGIVLGPKKGVYPSDEFVFLGYIEGDTSGRCAIYNKRKDVITIDSFLEKAHTPHGSE